MKCVYRHPLVKAAVSNGDLSVLESHVSDVTQQVLDAALLGACQHGHLQWVVCLLRAGANVDCRDEDSSTPLYLAAGADSTGLSALLVLVVKLVYHFRFRFFCIESALTHALSAGTLEKEVRI